MKKTDTYFPETRLSLIKHLQSGEDEAAWTEFVDIYRPVIYRMARRRGLQEADAEDLSQKVLMSVAGSIESWQKRENVPFRHWLRKVARNAVLKELTRLPRDRAVGGSAVLGMFNDHAETERYLEREVLLEHRRELFMRAAKLIRAEVAVETWQIFEMAVVNGIPIEEVAAKVGKSIGAAYAARGRVMHRLQRTVQRLEEGDAKC